MSIEVKNLSFSYRQHKVLDNVSFTVKGGEFAALLGPNGAGKTTLFRCMLGFLKDFSGSVICNGIDIASAGARRLAKLMAYIPQSASPAFNYTVVDTVLMGTNSSAGVFTIPGKAQKDAADYAIEKLGITELRNRGCRTLSGGEAQLVLIARAIAQGANILIMDEPSANLDLGNRHRVLSLARKLSRDGYTIIMSIHDPEQALVFADRAMMLSNGRIIADGAADEIIEERLIYDVYGVNVIVNNSRTGAKSVMFPALDDRPIEAFKQ